MKHLDRIMGAVASVATGALLATLIAIASPAPPANAAPAPLDIYPLASTYPASPDFVMTVNGQGVPVQDCAGYDIAQFAMGAGEATISITKRNNTAIGAFSISPLKLGLTGTKSGPTLTFTVTHDEYLIVKIDGRPELVIAIDPLETDRPPSSGTGIFNVTAAPYGAQPGVGYSTTAFQTALNDAAAWGSANAGQGTVFVPAGVYTLGTLYLRSNLRLYLAPGAVLKYTGERDHYDVHWRKLSQQRDVTWFLSTRYSTTNITISGRGIIDGDGMASLQRGNLGVNLLVPIYTDDFIVDGITFRESSSWAVMPTRSTDSQFRNIKMFNRFDMGENDGIDVMESTNVSVTNAIGIGLDDPFSTKTWANHIDLFAKVPGDPRPLGDVTFDDLVSWTWCYGLKVGQGVFQQQTNVTFKNATIYDSAVGIGVHHKYGTAGAVSIQFEDIDIERVTKDNDGNTTWMALWTGNTAEGIGPVADVDLTRVNVRSAGTTPARINGVPGAPITDVKFEKIRMPGSTSTATTLQQMNVTNVSDSSNIQIVP
ncbi:polygalacturonase [Agromyces sp. 3263]|uniref:glycosyl hydrolase family 28 protein n=1 Tax=Agromyces sp. 3263 TaxID=2817750 RepID=UPI002862FE28|nr:glycosyl hydrolase family 28 protein [Agromyces sp. 3263]MDR6906388.1 polygalacturonase [Agromyces sp. 3263]